MLTNDSDVDSAGNGETRVVSALRTGTEAGSGTAGAPGVALVGAHGSLTMNADGSYSYLINEADPAVQALRQAGQQITDVFTYTLQDAGGLSDTAQLTITIDGRNDAPVGVDDSVTAVEAGGTANGTAGANGSGNVLTNDSDVDSAGNGETRAVSGLRTGLETGGGPMLAVGAAVTGTYGSLTLNADGSYTYLIDENNPQVQALRVGQTLSDTFTYTVRDAAGLTDTAQLVVTLQGANDAPVANPDTHLAIDGAAAPTGNVLQTIAHTGIYADQADTDAEGDTLVVSQVNGGAGNVGSTIALTFGSIRIGADGAYTYTVDSANPAVAALVPGATLTETVSYQVSDGQGGTATSSLAIVIVGRNNEPTGTDRTLTGTEDTPLVLGAADFGFADIDAVSPAKDFASVRIDTVPATGTLLLNGVAVVPGQVVSVADIDAGRLVFQPPPDVAGPALASFTFSVGDGLGSFDLAPNTLTLDVTPVSDAPLLGTPVADASNSAQGIPIPLLISVGVADVNGPAPETLGAVTISGIPPGSILTNAAGDILTVSAGTATLTPAQLAGLTILPPPTQQADFTLTVSASSTDGVAPPALSSGPLLVKVPQPPPLNAPDPQGPTAVSGFLGFRANTFTVDMPSVWDAGGYGNRVINLPIPLHPIVFVEVTIAREHQARILADLRAGGTDVSAALPSEIQSVSIGSNLGMDPTIYVKHAVDLAESDRLLVQARTLGRIGRTSLSADHLLPNTGIFAQDPALQVGRQVSVAQNPDAVAALFVDAREAPVASVEAAAAAPTIPPRPAARGDNPAAPGARSFTDQLRHTARRGAPLDAMHIAYAARKPVSPRT